MTKDDKVNPFKILLVGDAGTGKTNLLTRLTKNKSDLTYAPTNGVKIDTHDILVDNNTIKTEIWDIAGREKYRNIAASFFHDATGILLVYDITNDATFENVIGWLKDIIKFADPKTVVKLVGNKSDLEHQRAVPIEKAEQFATDNGLSFIETSGLEDSNVKVTFKWMVDEICATMNSVSRNSDDCLFSTCSFIFNRVTKDSQVEHHQRDSSRDGTQPHEQQQPFHIVLVDIKKAADIDNPTIHCVEKPLEGDLKYVALSYRWGELQETAINTKLAYTALVTSFDLIHFYKLCRMMASEVDLKYMDYVWVDAICVDQTNYERRKATIHQMSAIYERASYIVAVPDLHMKYLKDTSTLNSKIMKTSMRYYIDIYHLIHGNTDQLARIEETWLNKYDVPKDPVLRKLLKASTNFFVNGFMKFCSRHRYYNAADTLDHLYEASQTAALSNGPDKNDDLNQKQAYMYRMNRLHDCNQVNCPLDFVHEEVPEWREKIFHKENGMHVQNWKQMIQERGTSIQQSMIFMGDLIEDWSSRVWVISEYNIARKKNNMKYWFIQLGTYIHCGVEDFTFFKFDFDDDPAFSAAIQNALSPHYEHGIRSVHHPPYPMFHQTMLTQLNQQTFFEMILKSKASKNEDRFYAIFPLSEYKTKIENKAVVDSWNIDTFVSVRLKLFEIMNTKDKLNLLFLSGNHRAKNLGKNLPTFATSSIGWSAPMDYFALNDNFNNSDYNFDLTSTSAITLCQSHENDNNSLPLPYLNLKPMEYLVNNDHIKQNGSDYVFDDNRAVWSRLKPEDPFDTNDIVCIPSIKIIPLKRAHEYGIKWSHHMIILNGNFEKNVWIIVGIDSHVIAVRDSIDWTHPTSDDHSAGFNIY